MTLIKQRLHSQDYYHNLDIFAADIRRMLTNCKCVRAALPAGGKGEGV